MFRPSDISSCLMGRVVVHGWNKANKCASVTFSNTCKRSRLEKTKTTYVGAYLRGFSFDLVLAVHIAVVVPLQRGSPSFPIPRPHVRAFESEGNIEDYPTTGLLCRRLSALSHRTRKNLES